MMKARVTKHLNIRTGSPRILPDNNPGYYKPNDIVTIIDTVLGDKYKGNNVWHKLEDSTYVWSGGLDSNVQQSGLDWWHHSYNITDVWRDLNTWGDGSTVAVIDSGIDLRHPFLDRQLVFGRSADPTVGDFADRDGHGTSVAGIICANRLNAFGTAPMCKLFMIKATESGAMTGDELKKGLASVPPDVDIINISQALEHSDKLKDDLRTFFNKHSEKVFVCGAGNDGIDEFVNNLPAALSTECQNVISIAGLNKFGQASQFFSCKSHSLTLASPSEEVMYLNMHDHSKLYAGSGTSFAAPIVAGLIALAKSYLISNQKFRNINDIVRTLKSSVTPRNPPQRELYGLGVLNPKLFADQIKT